MAENYFLNNDIKNWCIRTAFQRLERTNPSYPVRHILQQLKAEINEAADTEDETKAAAAKMLLKDWRVSATLHRYHRIGV